MKKCLVIALIVILSTGFTSCGISKKNANDEGKSKQEESVSKDKESDEGSKEETQNKNESEKNSSNELSGKWSDFKFSLNGKELKFPFNFKELEEEGWKINDKNKEEKLGSNQYTLAVDIVNGEQKIGVNFINDTSGEIPLSQCKIAGISLYASDIKKGNINFQVPGGINFDSSEKDIINAYGEPTRRTDGDGYATLIYEEKTNKVMRIALLKDKIDTIEFKNIS